MNGSKEHTQLSDNSGRKRQTVLGMVRNFLDAAERQEASRKLGVELVVGYGIIVAGMLVLAWLSMKMASYFYLN